MSEESIKYVMLKYLDEEEKIMGLPVDEFIPVSLILLFSFICKILFVGLVLSFLTVKLMRHFKHNQGRGFLFIVCYWNLNAEVGKALFSSFPSATERYYI